MPLRPYDKEWKATPEVVEQQATRNGRTLAQVDAAITRPKGRPFWIVDTTHEAWTGVPANLTAAIAAMPNEPSARWRSLHQRSYLPVADKAAELAWIRGLARGMDGATCDCASHWAKYFDAHPPTIDTPAEYETWAVAAHNVVNVRLKKPTLTIDQARQIHSPVRRKPYRFAYFTGSNRPGEGQRIAAMIRSARRAGAAEDFHAFAVEHVPDAINHRISADRSWKNHMLKIDLVAELAAATGEQYDAFVWLDSDNWFVHDPGDLRVMLRDNPIWVGMESDLRQSIQRDWYGMPIKGAPSVFDVLTAAGCRPDFMYGVNGGMWVVRREAVAEFHKRAFAACKVFADRGYPHATNDEPPLSVLGSTMVCDPEANTIAKWSHVWACDWVGRWTNQLPDGRPWVYKDWATPQRPA